MASYGRRDPSLRGGAQLSSRQRRTAPTRLALGPDAYDYIHEELTTRIAELESLEDISRGVAVDGPLPIANWR